MKIKTILSVGFILSIVFGLLWEYNDVEANNLLGVHKQNEQSEAEPICSDSLTFESLAQGDYYTGSSLEDFSGIPGEPSTIVASNWDQAEELQPTFPYLSSQLLQSVDYSEYFVFAILLGGRGHGGIEIIIDEVCIHENTISIEAQEYTPDIVTMNLTAPYHLVRVKKESNWSQEMTFVLFLDGQQVFTQAHAIAEPRRWQTLDKGEGSRAEVTDLMVIASEDEIALVADLLPQSISALQELDYEESYALVAFQGFQLSGGYGIEIENLSRTGNRIVVHTQARIPEQGSLVTPEATSPYHLIRVDRFYENGDEIDFVLSVNGSETLTRTVTIEQNPPLPTPTPAPTITPTPTPIVPVILADDYAVAPDGRIDVLIEATNFREVASLTLNVDYDPAVLRAVSCKSLAFEPNNGACNANFSSGRVRLNAIWLEAIDDVSLAKITFEAIGQIGHVSPLDIQVEIVTTITGQLWTADTIEGQVSIEQNPSVSTRTPTPTLTPTPAPIIAIIAAGDYTVAPSSQFDMLIEGADFEGVGGLTAEVGYDPAVLRAVSCEIPADEPISGACNTDAFSDTVRFNRAWLDGRNSDTLLVKITFEAIDQVGNVSPLRLQIRQNGFVDVNGQPLAVDTIDGQVSILEPTANTPAANSTPEPTSTQIPTLTNTPEPTSTPTPLATNATVPTSTSTSTVTSTPEPTSTPIPTATNTPEPTSTPIPTATNTPEPTSTSTPTATNTPEPTSTLTPTSTSTATSTSIPTNTLTPIATDTLTPTPISTNTPTSTSVPTDTSIPTATATSTPTSTNTPIPTPTISQEALGEDEPGDAATINIDAIEWVNWYEVTASALNLEAEQLLDMLDQGQSITEIASANDIDSQLVVNAIIDAERAMIESGVASGLFPQDEAQIWLAELPTIAAHFVQDATGYLTSDLLNGADWFAIAVENIGIEDDELWLEIEQGLSVADIAATHGSDDQNVIDAIVQAETNSVNQKVATGLISQEDANEWIAGLNNFVGEFVEMDFVDDIEPDGDEASGSDDSVDDESRNRDEQAAGSSSAESATIQAANMALVLRKNARTKTPATFPDNHIYLPILMK